MWENVVEIIIRQRKAKEHIAKEVFSASEAHNVS